MAARVLVIDDSQTTVQLITTALAQAGIDASSATDLASLDARLADGQYDVVLVDVNMPEMYGDDVVEFLRVQRKLNSKLLLYSDIDEAELAAKAQNAGADGYITKASGLEAAVAAVQSVLGGGSGQKPGRRRRRVLVVDDSEATAHLLEVELSAHGHEVLTAYSAEAATKIVLKKKTRPDLVLLDVRMPGINGEEFCRFVKSNSLFAGIQVVFCSAEEEAELKMLVERAGADGFIRKDALIARDILDLLQ